MKCPLCSALLVQKIDNEYFDCGNCQALVKDPALYIDAEQEKAFYELHNNDVHDKGYQKFTSPITNYVLNHYSPQNKGLDFGSGTGPVISKVLRDNGFQNIIQYDPFFCPNDEALNQRYDFIFSCEVVEHFHQPKKEYQRLLNMLKPEGKLLIMTHSYDGKVPFENWYYRNDPTHVFIHRAETFEFIANVFNLSIEFQDERLTVLRSVNI